MTFDGQLVTSATTLKVPKLRLGNRWYRGLVFGTDPDSVGKLGIAFLSRHRLVTFDFPNSRLYLTQAGEPVSPARDHHSGILLKRQGTEIVITRVVQDSPGAKAGIQPQDVLLKIDDTDVTELPPWRVGSLLFPGAKKEIELSIRRGTKQHEVVLRFP